MKHLTGYVAAVIIAAGGYTMPAAAAEKGKVIYKNDFSGGQDSSFQIDTGTLTIASEDGNPYLQCVKGELNAVRFALGPEEVENIDISFRLRITDLANVKDSRVVAYFRSTTVPSSSNIAYQLQFWNSKTALAFSDPFADESQLLTLQENTEAKNIMGKWNNVQISLRETRIIVYVNGRNIVDMSDAQYPESGGIGFASTGGSFDVDDLIVRAYYGSDLPEPVANERPKWMGDEADEEEEDMMDTGLPRFNLGGGEEDTGDNTESGGDEVPAVVKPDPDKLTINSYIALGLIAGLVLMAASTFATSLMLYKSSKKTGAETKNAPKAETDKEV